MGSAVLIEQASQDLPSRVHVGYALHARILIAEIDQRRELRDANASLPHEGRTAVAIHITEDAIVVVEPLHEAALDPWRAQIDCSRFLRPKKSARYLPLVEEVLAISGNISRVIDVEPGVWRKDNGWKHECDFLRRTLSQKHCWPEGAPPQ